MLIALAFVLEILKNVSYIVQNKLQACRDMLTTNHVLFQNRFPFFCKPVTSYPDPGCVLFHTKLNVSALCKSDLTVWSLHVSDKFFLVTVTIFFLSLYDPEGLLQ